MRYQNALDVFPGTTNTEKYLNFFYSFFLCFIFSCLVWARGDWLFTHRIPQPCFSRTDDEFYMFTSIVYRKGRRTDLRMC